MGKTWVIAVAVLGIVFMVGCGGGERAQQPKEATESVAPAVATLDESDPLYAAIQQLNDAASRGDLEALKELVAEDCQFIFGGRKQSYWDIVTKEYLEAVQESQTISVIEEAKVLERSDDQVTVRVVAVSKGKTGGGRATSRNVYRKYDGKWKLAEMEVENVSFSTAGGETSGRVEDKIPTEAFAQYIPMYPGMQFAEIETPWDMGSGPLFRVEKEVLSCVQGTTPDSITDVLKFYRDEMKDKWQDFRESTGASVSAAGSKEYIQLAGEKTQPDGKRIGINLRLEKEAEGTRIIIVMAPLRPEEEPAPSVSP
jgi:ketosteroid isomerase-like protein